MSINAPSSTVERSSDDCCQPHVVARTAQSWNPPSRRQPRTPWTMTLITPQSLHHSISAQLRLIEAMMTTLKSGGQPTTATTATS